tara:strand:- start:762 stop:1811 length:1050 start_codon:yes stop_codon:yes gene_type:complete
MEKLKNVGIIGLGNMGRKHLRVLSNFRDINKIYIFDNNKKAINLIDKKPFIILSQNIQQVIDNVDYIFIVTPTSTHFDLIKRCLGKIKNIFVEKPICDNSYNSKKILELSKIYNTKISVGFIERFNPVISPLKRLFNKPCINIDFFRTDGSSSRITDVDVIADLMIHDIDLALLLNGSINSISGYGKIQDNQIVFACAHFHHSNGSYSRLMASKITEKKMRYLDVTFDDKFINCNLLTKDLYIHNQFSSMNMNDKEFRIGAKAEQVILVPTEPLFTEIYTFLNSKEKTTCNNNINLLADQRDAHMALEICDKIRRDIISKSATHNSLSSMAFIENESGNQSLKNHIFSI